MTWNATVRQRIGGAKLLATRSTCPFSPRRSLPAGVAALGVATLVIAATDTAYAYLRTTGSGSGQSVTASGYSSAITGNVKTAAASTTTLLRPGGTGDVAVKITNSNTFDIKVTGVTLTAGGATGCTTPALTAATPTGYTVNGSAATLPLSIPAGTTTTLVEVGAVTMGSPSNDCQNKTLDVPLTVSWTG